MQPIEITFPFPPSVNHYWGERVLTPKRGGKPIVIKYVTKDGKAFSAQVHAICHKAGLAGMKIHGDLSVHVVLYPPDRRARDVDNYNKALLDSLTKAGVWIDDYQASRLLIERMDSDPSSPRAEVRISIRQQQGRLV